MAVGFVIMLRNVSAIEVRGARVRVVMVDIAVCGSQHDYWLVSTVEKVVHDLHFEKLLGVSAAAERFPCQDYQRISAIEDKTR